LKEKIFFVSLGCDKNLVDSEVMLGILRESGYLITNEEQEADIIIINTCSFIHDAKQESIETIFEMIQYKEQGNCKGVIVTGCLSQRYQDELVKEIPEIDGVLGATNYDEILKTVNSILSKKKYISFKDINYTPDPYINRITTTISQFAYLKISEGCNNNCTYCIIPKLRGKLRSRTIESLVDEASYLAKQGKKELILVAQDLAKYGIDLYGENKLTDLLHELCKIEDIEWIRLLYCYPEDITDDLIDVIAKEDKILKYIDIPIQHISNEILKKMARKSNKEKIITVINKLRSKIPNICIRTTLIVGFPGETDEHFEELEQFVSESKFDRLGVFTYSPEEDTKAAIMDNQINEELKESRRERIMLIQQKISEENNSKLIGSVLDVIIEGYIPDDNVYIGRTYRDAPNVDGLIFIESSYELLSGQIVEAKIIDSNQYDLIGVISDEYSE
jgi:ribosomal protein S12 methylthiotransferase